MGLGSIVKKVTGKTWDILSGQDKLKKQQAFEREKMQNAHQWEVQDLQAAGLNPILSAGSSPNMGGTPAGDSPIWPELGNQALSAVDKVLQKKKIDNEKILMDAEATQAKAQAKMAETSARKAETEESILKKQAQAETPRLEQRRKYNESSAGKILNYIGMGSEDLRPAASIIGTGVGLFGMGRMLSTARGIKTSVDKAVEKGAFIRGRDMQGNYTGPAPTRQDWINQPTYKRGYMRY